MRNNCIYIYRYNDGCTCYKHIKYKIKRTIKCLNYYSIIDVLIKQHNKYLRIYCN